MKFVEHQFYHVYNQGNNREPIFFNDRNYRYFIRLIQRFVAPKSDLIAYCLMPNHFHFLVHTNEISVQEQKVGSLQLTALSNGIRNLLTSYSHAINKQENRTGSLFRQKTKAQPITRQDEPYLRSVFHYIHQNPLRAGLVNEPEAWLYSSYRDYVEDTPKTICNKELGMKVLDFSSVNELIDESKKAIPEEHLLAIRAF